MALPSPVQAGTAILVLVAVLEALLYLWNRQRGVQESRREGALHDLESGRRLTGIAERRFSRGGYEAAARICERARAVLMEARRRAAEGDDRETDADARAELARCAVIMEKSVRRIQDGGNGPRKAPDGGQATRRLVDVEMLLDECEGMTINAEEAFAAGNIAEARDLYRAARSRLNEARRAAVEAGNRSYVKLIESKLSQVQRALSSANARLLDGRPVLEAPRHGQVKGIISPYFRREDGSFEPRPR